MAEPWHGTSGGYTNHRCRCEDCRNAWRIAHLAYMVRHPEQRAKNRERTRAWCAAHPEEKRAYNLAYRQAHPERIARYNQQRLDRAFSEKVRRVVERLGGEAVPSDWPSAVELVLGAARGKL